MRRRSLSSTARKRQLALLRSALTVPHSTHTHGAPTRLCGGATVTNRSGQLALRCRQLLPRGGQRGLRLLQLAPQRRVLVRQRRGVGAHGGLSLPEDPASCGQRRRGRRRAVGRVGAAPRWCAATARRGRCVSAASAPPDSLLHESHGARWLDGLLIERNERCATARWRGGEGGWAAAPVDARAHARNQACSATTHPASNRR